MDVGRGRSVGRSGWVPDGTPVGRDKFGCSEGTLAGLGGVPLDLAAGGPTKGDERTCPDALWRWCGRSAAVAVGDDCTADADRRLSRRWAVRNVPPLGVDGTAGVASSRNRAGRIAFLLGRCGVVDDVGSWQGGGESNPAGSAEHSVWATTGDAK